MADDGSAQSQTVWPLPKFYFQVKWDDSELAFQEVSGLDIETEPLEYRAGNSPVFGKVKMPGMTKSVMTKSGSRAAIDSTFGSKAEMPCIFSADSAGKFDRSSTARI